MKLSYTSLNNIHNGHEWLNKQMGIPVPDYPFLKEGKEAHRIIQGHLSGKNPHLYLKDLKITFPIVEEKDFDEKCKFEFNVTPNYTIFGFVDGLDPDNKRILEIKTSSNNWSISKFADSMQRKIYGLAFLDYKETFLVTGSKDPEKWVANPPKIFSVPITANDREDAKAWIAKAIAILEKGDFTGGLDENGKCTGCFWNMANYKHLANCNFM